jgi:signal transduction histidine kinase
MTMRSRSPATIFVVENDRGVARRERLCLERAGYTVISAATPHEALARIAGATIDLVVLDDHMPGNIDGLALFRRMRTAGLNAPAILVVALENESRMTAARRAGVSDFLPRTPRFVSHLLPIVDRAVQQIKNERELAEMQSDRSRLSAELDAERALKQEAEKNRDQFLAALAHELRNPLAPISNAVQIMQVEGPLGQSFLWSLKVIDDQVKQMTRMVDDLLDVSRITRGRIELQRERIALSYVVGLAVDASRPLLNGRNHSLAVTLPRTPVHVDVDTARITQVLANLLNNAARYTDLGGRIELVAEQAGSEVVIRVRDNGIGIASDMLQKVFDVFTQVDQSLSRSRGGLGMGLATVRSLVELHGGRVMAASAGLGEGSEFAVYLPSSEPGAPAEPAVAARAKGLPRRLVLVVDDNLDNAASLAVLLTALGQEVLTAHDGPAALELARRHTPQVVLLDIGLPGMDGYEVARRCRDDVGLAGCVLVAMTGYGKEEDRHRSQQAGFAAHLVKPVYLEDLRLLLADAPV